MSNASCAQGLIQSGEVQAHRFRGWLVAETDMRRLNAIVLLAVMAVAPMAVAQSNPPTKPSTQTQAKPPVPGEEPSAGYNVNVAPDPSATAMADPGTAAEFGSPSVTDSPSSPMPFAASWPPIKPGEKRPSWVKKAPAKPATQPPPPR